MAIENFNNSIGFPMVTNKTSGMLITHLSVQKPQDKPQIKPEIPVQKPSQKGMCDNSKYFLGAAALAASVIAGIYVYKGRKPEQALDAVKNNVIFYTKKEPKTGTDNKYFIKYLENLKPDFDLENKYQHPVGKFGAYRVDEVLRPSAINHSEFFRKDGSLFASVDWDDDGKVISYTLMNKAGDIISQI